MFTLKFPLHCFEDTGAIGPGSKYISFTPLRPPMDILTLPPKHHRPMLLACLYATSLPLHPSLHLHHRPTSSVFIIVIIFIIVFSIVMVLIIVIVHPLSLQSSYISLFFFNIQIVFLFASSKYAVEACDFYVFLTQLLPCIACP
jgi:hypothetical protein